MFVISLYNLKGGVGKTSSCVNFAYMAARDGYNTLIWDLDPQGAASFYYKSKPKQKGVAKKIIEHNINLEDAILSTDYHNLDIIPADTASRKLDIVLDDLKKSKKQLKALLKQVSSEYDFVFIDSPPAFSLLVDNIFQVSDMIFMPVIPTTLSVRTYNMVKEYLEAGNIGIEKLACFFTMADMRKNMHKDVMSELYKDQRFFEHYIPNLSKVEKMGTELAPLEIFAPSSYANTCYRALWREVKEGVLE
ncbi:MAG: ParA family protein [Chitinophagaceae bacterium]|nr:ParA family protein [Chitinophagaceae bacterium]MCB9044625.1 ParA family protein [Chitinophagales bacterium]